MHMCSYSTCIHDLLYTVKNKKEKKRNNKINRQPIMLQSFMKSLPSTANWGLLFPDSSFKGSASSQAVCHPG